MKNITLITLLLSASSAFAQLTLPWHQDDATHRTVYKISSAHKQTNPQVTLPVPATQKMPCIVDADAPQAPLPAYFEKDRCTLLLPGSMTPDKPKHLIAYSGGALKSPRQPEKPISRSDFAAAELKTPWSFNKAENKDGNQKQGA